ncbi:MAG: signal peptidase I [Clostridiales bacterium]|nr:signal peptidase I [Clostridiales bacterium]
MTKKKPGIFSKIFTILSYILMAILVVIIVMTLIAKFNNKVPSVLGYSVLRISSGSMETTLPTGSYIVVKKTDPKDVKVGDIITFYSDDPTIYGMPNTHRVIGIKTGEDGKLIFQTKGDNNLVEDKYPPSEDALIGVFQTRLALVSVLSGAFGGNGTVVVIILAAVAIVCIWMAITMLRGKDDDEEEKDKKEVKENEEQPKITITEEDIQKYLEEKARAEEQKKQEESSAGSDTTKPDNE